MNIKGFKAKDGSVYKYDYDALVNKPAIPEGPGSDGNAESDVLCVTIQSDNDGYTADKTVTEIYEAYQAGKVVVCYVINLDGNFATNLVVCGSDIACFSASVGDVVIAVTLTENGVQVEYVDILTENDLPDDIGGGISVTGAKVGQTVRISAVDENGSPTAWEPADFPDSGGNVDQSGVEPAEDDIPKVFYGAALPQTKDDTVMSWRYISKTEDISAYCETKAQGNSSMSYAKKNQTTKLYADAACEEKLKVDFKGWGKQRKFCMKANWIDLSHARNIVSCRLWADCIKSRADYESLPELLRTSPNHGVVDGFPVKLYANGVYQGRYTINIPKDAWMANMDDSLDEHCILCGENYVSGCFRAEANINESDWTDEVHDTVPASIKTRWNEVISFIMNSTDEEFKANLGQYFYVDSLIDYDLFGLASCGLDAFGKNQLYMTYDGQKWIAQIYDADSTWGLYWNGSKFVATDYARTSYEDMISGRQGNLLYMRLEQLFWSELQARWAELKNGALSIENIINRFERFVDIAPAELVKEDYASTTGGGKFTGIPSQTTNNIQQIRAFALARQAWTDEYVAGLTPEIPIPCEGITLDKTALTFTGEGTQTVTATVIPDGCTDDVVWVCSNPEIAVISVSGYVCTVEAIANGNATITATCGDYSASCSVAVSGIAEPVPCTGITLDKSTLTFTEEGSQTIVATVTPADTTDKVVWSSDAPGVATVENGVVTAVGDGTANITATCGNYSASCTVSVALPVNPVLYSAKNIDVSGGNVDTGVKLSETDMDYTIVYKAEFSGIIGGADYLFKVPNSASCYQRNGVRMRSIYGDGALIDMTGTYSSGDKVNLVVTHKSGANSAHFYMLHARVDGEVLSYESEPTGNWSASSSPVLITANGLISNVQEFTIYNYVLSEDEITEQLKFGTACTGITLDKTELTLDGENPQTLIATVTPADTYEKIEWASSDGFVAIVKNGVVTPMTNGTCTITATCGTYSASCSVTVTGMSSGDEKIVYQNFSPNGESFSKLAGINFGAGDYIEASIDLSTCTGSKENILSIGDIIAAFNGPNCYHFYFTKSGAGGSMIRYLIASGTSGAALTSTLTSTNLIIKINSEGCYFNGELMEMQNENTEFIALSALQIGSMEGNVRSKATYNYIKVVRNRA